MMWHTKSAPPSAKLPLESDPAASLLLNLFATHFAANRFSFHGLPISIVPFPSTSKSFGVVLKSVATINAHFRPPRGQAAGHASKTHYAESSFFTLPLSPTDAHSLMQNPHLRYWEEVYKGPHPKLFQCSNATTSFYNSSKFIFSFLLPYMLLCALTLYFPSHLPLIHPMELIHADPTAFRVSQHICPSCLTHGHSTLPSH